MAFTALNKILESVLGEKNLSSSDIEAYKVFASWEDIVGKRVGDHTRPVRITRDVLYVEVNDHLWLAQLKYMKGDMLKKLEKSIKPGLFKDLKFFLKGIE
jgi:predicted nucleic acid-binding Zn ribbon protein